MDWAGATYGVDFLKKCWIVGRSIFKKNKKIGRPNSNIFWKSRPHNGPWPNPQRRKWPQMDSLVMNFSPKSTIFIVFYNVSGHFSWKPTFPFYPIYILFTEDFVFRLQKPVALLISWKPTGKNPISNCPFLHEYKTRQIPDPSRQKRNALLCRKFSISARVHRMKIQNMKSIV